MNSKLRNQLSHYKDVFYNKYYLPQIIFRNKQRKRLKNKDFSLLTANCVGGYLYHQLGLPFTSPTINLMIYNQHFIKLLDKLKYFMSLTPKPAEDSNFPNIPCASLEEIIIHFTHYDSSEEGIQAWEKRKKRINYDNLYVIISDVALNKDEIQALGNINCKKIIVLTSKDYGYDHCLYIPEFTGQKNIGNYLGKTLSGKWKFEKYFDFVGWVNSDDPVAQHFYIGKHKNKFRNR